MGPYAGVDYNLTFAGVDYNLTLRPLQSRLCVYNASDPMTAV
jgi:hypothetical protein